MDMIGNRTLGGHLEERADLYGDRDLWVFESAGGEIECFTYRQVDRRVNQLANGLLAAGIEVDSKVVVHLPNCSPFLLTWFALAKIGAVMVPTNTANTAAEMRYQLAFSDAVAIVTSSSFLGVIRQATADLPSPPRIYLIDGDGSAPDTRPWAGLWRGQSERFAAVKLSPEHPAQILFTSGTTADPKGVVLTHANCLFSGEQAAKLMRVAPGERCLSALPCFHCNAQTFVVLTPLAVGAVGVLIETFSASRFWTQVRSHRANLISLLSAMLRTVIAQPRSTEERDHAVRIVNYGINCTDQEKADFEERFGVALLNGYGLTEAMTIVASAPLDGRHNWPSVGLPAIGREVRIVDALGREVPAGTIGQIVCKGTPGRTLFKEYYKNPEATAATLVDGWLQTGDAGYMDEAGYLYFFERMKDVVKRGGENVSTGEVERALLEHPAVLECAVVGIPDPIKDEAILAYVVLRPDHTPTPEALISHCAQRLAKFKVPQFIKVCSSLPKTAIGKIQKKALKKEI